MHKLLTLLLAASAPLAAARIDVTANPLVPVGTGKDLAVSFGVWNYGLNNPGYSPYPTDISFLAAARPPEEVPVGMAPGTDTPYFAGYLFEVTLESLDGAISLPVVDPTAARLGLPEGWAVLTPGTVARGDEVVSAAMLGGSWMLTPELSERLFGPGVAARGDSAVIRLRNAGLPLEFGLGEPYALRNSIFTSVRGLGPAETSGVSGPITVHNPEPGTWLTLAGGLLVFGYAGRRRYLRGSARLRERSLSALPASQRADSTGAQAR